MQWNAMQCNAMQCNAMRYCPPDVNQLKWILTHLPLSRKYKLITAACMFRQIQHLFIRQVENSVCCCLLSFIASNASISFSRFGNSSNIIRSVSGSIEEDGTSPSCWCSWTRWLHPVFFGINSRYWIQLLIQMSSQSTAYISNILDRNDQNK